MIFNAIATHLIKRTIKDLELDKVAVGVLKSNTSEIEDVNIGQLEKGENTDGLLLRPMYRNSQYEAYKRAYKGLRTPSGTPNLRDTGATQKSIKAFVNSKEIKFTFIDLYNLEQKYGEFVGLNPSGQETVKDDILRPEMQEEIRKKLK